MEELVAKVQEVLRTTPNRWLELTQSVSVEALRRAPAGGEWSPLECLNHLLDTELGAFQVRLASFLEGRERLAAFDPDAAGMKPDSNGDPLDIARRFAEARGASLVMLAAVTGEDLDRAAEHEEYGRVTLRELLNEWPAHDLNHTIQAERVLMQPFIAGCGPWRETFTDHDFALAGRPTTSS